VIVEAFWKLFPPVTKRVMPTISFPPVVASITLFPEWTIVYHWFGLEPLPYWNPNEKVDLFAKQAATSGRKLKFKVSYTDYYASSARDLRKKTSAHLKDSFLTKGKQYYSYFCNGNPPFLSWFSRLAVPREQIVLITRFRSNHYNPNASLYRKNITDSAACDCGDPHQDINHKIFYCPQTRLTASYLISYLRWLSPYSPVNIFPFLYIPSLKLCRLLASFLKSSNILVWTSLKVTLSSALFSIPPPPHLRVSCPLRELHLNATDSLADLFPMLLGTRAIQIRRRRR